MKTATSKTKAEEKADEIAEFYLSDCACDNDTKCDSCSLKQDLFYAFLIFKGDGFKQGLETALQMAKAAVERQSPSHYAESIANEIEAKLKECK